MANKLLSLLLTAAVAAQASATPINVYILAGQSNMAGGANVVELDPNEALLKLPQLSFYEYLLDGVATPYWEQLAPRQAGGANAYFGPELSFAQAMERRLGVRVAIIKVAYNGTGLATHWLPSLNTLYATMRNKVDASLVGLADLGYEPVMSGFLWTQGEGDGNVLSRAQAYGANLTALANAVWTDFGQMPFVYNQLHADVARTYRTEVRAQQASVAGGDMIMVDVDDQLLKTIDMVHFTTAMTVELGRRFADSLAPSGDFTDDGLVNGEDLAAWSLSFGDSRVGDGNADGFTDGQDFLIWQRQLSMTTPTSVSVAEPGSLLLGLSARALFGRRAKASRSLGPELSKSCFPKRRRRSRVSDGCAEGHDAAICVVVDR